MMRVQKVYYMRGHAMLCWGIKGEKESELARDYQAD
jgi:hypothetical protein